MGVNTTGEDRNCVFMDGWTREQISGAVGVALAEMDEQVNVVVSALSRLPEMERDRITDEVLSGMESCLERVQEAVLVSC